MMKLMVENGMRDKSFTPHTSCALSLFTMTSLWGGEENLKFNYNSICTAFIQKSKYYE